MLLSYRVLVACVVQTRNAETVVVNISPLVIMYLQVTAGQPAYPDATLYLTRSRGCVPFHQSPAKAFQRLKSWLQSGSWVAGPTNKLSNHGSSSPRVKSRTMWSCDILHSSRIDLEREEMMETLTEDLGSRSHCRE
jgi:hypothetical protein